MKKTLLTSKRIVTVIVAIVVVVLISLSLGGCSEYVEIYKRLDEKERLRQEQIEEEAKKEEISNYLEEIYNSYIRLGENEKLVQEFERFLEENFGDKERLLNCLASQKIYNSMHEEKNKIQEYLEKEEEDILLNAEEDLIKLYDDYQRDLIRSLN